MPLRLSPRKFHTPKRLLPFAFWYCVSSVVLHSRTALSRSVSALPSVHEWRICVADPIQTPHPPNRSKVMTNYLRFLRALLAASDESVHDLRFRDPANAAQMQHMPPRARQLWEVSGMSGGSNVLEAPFKTPCWRSSRCRFLAAGWVHGCHGVPRDGVLGPCVVGIFSTCFLIVCSTN